MGLVPDSDILTDTDRSADDILQRQDSASSTMRSAIEVWYVCPDPVVESPAEVPTLAAIRQAFSDAAVAAGKSASSGTELGSLVATHGIALALEHLTTIDSGQTQSTRTNAKRAHEWLDAVRDGSEKLNLPRRAHDDQGVGRRIVAFPQLVGRSRETGSAWSGT